MDKKIICIVLIVLLLIVLIYNNKEHFYSDHCDDCNGLNINNPPKDGPDCCGNYNIVYNSNGTEKEDYKYDLELYGPKCLNTCLVEHVAKLKFAEDKDVLKYNREHPSVGFCHLHNDKTNRTNICGENCNCLENSHCKIDNNICVEKNLNYLSGGAILNSTKCSGGDPEGCINKYMPNIESIKLYNDAYVKSLEQCS